MAQKKAPTELQRLSDPTASAATIRELGVKSRKNLEVAVANPNVPIDWLVDVLGADQNAWGFTKRMPRGEWVAWMMDLRCTAMGNPAVPLQLLIAPEPKFVRVLTHGFSTRLERHIIDDWVDFLDKQGQRDPAWHKRQQPQRFRALVERLESLGLPPHEPEAWASTRQLNWDKSVHDAPEMQRSIEVNMVRRMIGPTDRVEHIQRMILIHDAFFQGPQRSPLFDCLRKLFPS